MASGKTHGFDVEAALESLSAAAARQQLSRSAADNVRRWLTDERYAVLAPQVCQHVAEEKWAVLDDVFFREIPFGTAGRRGRMYPIGCNAINEYTVAQTAQGLANYVPTQAPADRPLRCAVGYDPRHGSRKFAELCSEVMAAAGFQIFFLDGTWSTPLLSFTVREAQCHCGIMVSASHNPPSDNALKIFWSSGGQVRPSHDEGIMRSVAQVEMISREPFADARARGRIVCCQAEMDTRYQAAVLKQAQSGPRDLKILYSPLHGVGSGSVLPVLVDDGFRDVEMFEPHALAHGDFPNVPDNIANPERPEVFDALIVRAEQTGAHLVLASDPDADRVGCAAPLVEGGRWQTLSGNQIGALLTDFVLGTRSREGSLSRDSYIVKTLVTSEMPRRVAELYGVRTFGDVLTGFKWIAQVVDELGPENFIFGMEEAHGYMVGDYIRDKDAAVAAMLLAELAAQSRQQGLTLHEVLDGLYTRVGYHAETTIAHTFEGAQGMAELCHTMDRLRRWPPTTLAGAEIVAIRDYKGPTALAQFAGKYPPSDQERDLLVFDVGNGNYAAVRPSGTEPKLKFYFFAYRPPTAQRRLDEVRRATSLQLAGMRSELLRAARLAP